MPRADSHWRRRTRTSSFHFDIPAYLHLFIIRSLHVNHAYVYGRALAPAVQLIQLPAASSSSGLDDPAIPDHGMTGWHPAMETEILKCCHVFREILCGDVSPQVNSGTPAPRNVGTRIIMIVCSPYTRDF